MRVCCLGSTTLTDLQVIPDALEYAGVTKAVSELISSASMGVPQLAIQYALKVGLPYRVFPAEYNTGESDDVQQLVMLKYAEKIVVILREGEQPDPVVNSAEFQPKTTIYTTSY